MCQKKSIPVKQVPYSLQGQSPSKYVAVVLEFAVSCKVFPRKRVAPFKGSAVFFFRFSNKRSCEIPTPFQKLQFLQFPNVFGNAKCCVLFRGWPEHDLTGCGDRSACIPDRMRFHQPKHFTHEVRRSSPMLVHLFYQDGFLICLRVCNLDFICSRFQL